MSQGIYGTRIPATVEPSTDVEIYYNFKETRTDDAMNSASFIKLDPSLLTQADIVSDDSSDNQDLSLEGMYNLKLPIRYFSQKGYYTIYIKPREYKCEISDVSTLYAYPDVMGIVIDISKLDDTLATKARENNGLVGYRILYYDENKKRMNISRIITSNYTCEPITQSSTSSSSRGTVSYRFNDSSSLVFITLTPSTAPTFKPNVTPYIGKIGQTIGFVNTSFEPVMIDLEMVENDADTISSYLMGNQLRNLDNGLVTTFTKDNEIQVQHEFYTLKDPQTGNPIYEVRKNQESAIDFNETIDDK